jgi:DNA-binding transcriptional MerR regulator
LQISNEDTAMRPNELKLSSSYLIGELCAHFAISPRALRFYEEKGLIKPRRGVQKTRHYSRADFNRVQVISWGRRAELSLEEIRELLDDYDRGDGGRRQLDNALAKLRDKAESLEAQRAHIAGEIAKLEARLEALEAETAPSSGAAPAMGRAAAAAS